MDLNGFDAAIARKAIQYDLVTFLQDDLLNWLATFHNMPDYSLHVLSHEVLHAVTDWSNQQLVIDGVHPFSDKQVVETLAAFVRYIGGWNALRLRYLA
jgi:hypothetical protein